MTGKNKAVVYQTFCHITVWTLPSPIAQREIEWRPSAGPYCFNSAHIPPKTDGDRSMIQTWLPEHSHNSTWIRLCLGYDPAGQKWWIFSGEQGGPYLSLQLMTGALIVLSVGILNLWNIFFHPRLGYATDIKSTIKCNSKNVNNAIKCPCGLFYVCEASRAQSRRICDM